MNTTSESDYVYRLGPINSDSGPVSVYLILSEGEESESVLGDDDDQAMAQIAQMRSGRTVYCHPDLAEAGREKGIEPKDMDDGLAHDLAMIVMGMALEEDIASIDHQGVLHQFGRACGAYWRSRAWEKSFARSVVTLQFEGMVNGTCEGWAMGASGNQIGFVVYPKLGSVERLTRLVQEQDVEGISQIDSIGVNLVEEPQFALKPFQEVFGLPRVPVPTRSQGGARVPIGSAEMMALSAALQAASGLSDSSPGTRASVEVESDKVTVVLRPKPSDA